MTSLPAWNATTARSYASDGGERVLFACGQPGCAADSKRAAEVPQRSGVAAKVVYGEGEGHGYGGKVAEGLAREWAWLTDGDARWAR